MIDKIDKAILAELNHWDLSCSEEPELKIELAKALGRAVKNCFTSDVAEQSEQLVCDHKYQDNVCDWRGVRKCIICGQMEKAN